MTRFGTPTTTNSNREVPAVKVVRSARRAAWSVAVRLAIPAAVTALLVVPMGGAQPTAPVSFTPNQLTAYVGAGNSSDLPNFQSEVGSTSSYAMDFLDDTSWASISSPWIYQQWAASGKQLVLGVPMLPVTGSPTLAQGATGQFNTYFQSLAAGLVADGQSNAVLRLGWEFNATAYPWSAAGQASAFVAYWQQIVTTMRAVPGANFTILWNPLRGDNGAKDAAIGDLTTYYPGDAYVDMVGMDIYDGDWNTYPGIAPEFAEIVNEHWGLAWLASFGALHNKPLAIPEMGLGPGPSAPNSGPITGTGYVSGGDDPTFINDMAEWVGENNVVEDGFWDYQYSSIDNGTNPLTRAALTNFAANAAQATPGAQTFTPPTFTTMTPAGGNLAGGTPITITGAKFTGTTNVTFGTIAATNFTVVNDTTITAIAPPQPVGSHNVVVTTLGGLSPVVANDNYTYYVTPTLSKTSPAGGNTAGGNTVTLQGTGFTGATTVSFAGVPAAGLTVVNSTIITAIAPTQAAGPVAVSISTPGGTSNTATYVYDATPTLSGLTPAGGNVAGGTTVTITGAGFATATGVTFGSVAASTFTVVNPTTITAVAPAQAAGTQNVSITTLAGATATVPGPDSYTYAGTPAVSALSAAAGNVAGGNTVTVTGSGFTGGTAVMFGTVAATSFTVVNDTTITAVAPAQPTGSHNVYVTTPSGTAPAVAASSYSYFVTPTLAKTSPGGGNVAGGNTVTLQGTGFTGATAVSFGITPATSFTVVNSTVITAVAPAKLAGTVNVTVTTPGGTTVSAPYLYAATPTVSALSQAGGNVAGGPTITITGTGFTGPTTVAFGTLPAASFTVVNATTITANVPAQAAATINVTVTTLGGTTPLTGPDHYTYAATPVVATLNQTGGNIAGGNTITVTGTSFTGATAVTIGTVLATSFTVINATTIQATVPAQAAGSHNLYVTTIGGTSAANGTDSYTYYVTATLAKTSPGGGSIAGGNTVTLQGTGFTGATTVTFAGVTATNLVITNSTLATVTAPAGPAGAAAVTITTPGGTSPAVTYTYS